ncbi:hypothetical protein [Raineyella sp.]|uniref:Uncharacterized protein n=1 Tax=bioreactor metagenome TaxID=1076179 RepID=A0A645D8I7_9ZZZZ|nr:hypothetical protein [Raineyella sp.]MEA5155739.1 hypothetical protein [Raineyella sp.]
MGPSGVSAATIVVGAAVTLLRLSGRIDPPGRAAALHSLAVLEGTYSRTPELERQRLDLETWHNPDEAADDKGGR